MRRFLMNLCACGSACPKVFADETAEEGKQIVITDDYNGQLAMSKEQFRAFVEKAKRNEFKV